jgi:predicted metal-binding protein
MLNTPKVVFGGHVLPKKTQPNTTQKPEEFVKVALSMGALDAKLIDPKDIVVADWVRLKCQYGCGGYNRILTCPPFSPTAEQMRRVLQGYSRALFMRVPNETQATRDMLAKLERHIFLAGYHSAFGLHAGPCELCKECNLQRCTHPRIARPSLEACGIDVYATARKNGFPIRVRKTRREKPTYYSMVLIE